MTCRLFSCLLISWLLYSCPVCAARCVHRWSARSSSRVAFSASAVCVVLALGSCCWHTVCSGNLFLWEGILQSITVSSAYCLVRLAGCPLHSMHRGQPPLRRHRPVSTLVEASGLCCRGNILIYQHVSLPRWEKHFLVFFFRPKNTCFFSVFFGAVLFLTSRSVCLRRGGHPTEARRFRSVGWHSCPG